MDIKDLQATDWFCSLVEDVGVELARLTERQHDQGPALRREHGLLQERIDGWSVSLAKRDLNPTLRLAIESDWARALERQQEIQALLAEQDGLEQVLNKVLDPQQVISRLERLGDVLATNNPTAGNLELSLHIDRIDCFGDGQVVMRSCKLGTLAGATELLAHDDVEAVVTPVAANSYGTATPRRRTLLRTSGLAGDAEALQSAAYMAADPQRFAGVADTWFWIDEFHIPERAPCWSTLNAERVFERRQEGKLSYQELAHEFGVTSPTIGAAIGAYLLTHPGAVDNVKVGRGGRRKPTFDLTAIGSEARQLFEAGWSREKLATKYVCSPPTIVKALELAYANAGLHFPTLQERRNLKAAEARRLFNLNPSLADIAAAMGVTDVSARRYLQESFKAEGKRMPDLRKLRTTRQRPGAGAGALPS